MNYQHMINLISDPLDGPFEGEDFLIDNQGLIQVTGNNIKTAALIMRKVNTSSIFPKRLIKMGCSGDSILLGFDTLSDSESVYSDNIGPKADTNMQVRRDEAGKFFVYVNNKRSTKQFKSMTAVKKFVRKLDQELRQIEFTSEDLSED